MGTLLGSVQRHAGAFLRSAVPSGDVLEIWQGGDAEYDRHRQLPSA